MARCLFPLYSSCLPKLCSFHIGTKVRRLSFLLSFPCLTFSYTFCPSSHQPGCPPYFLLSLPACLSCSLFIYQLSSRFNLVVGILLSPLDLCNTPTSKNSMCKANRMIRGHLNFTSFVFFNKDGITSFPGFWCEAGSPHNNEEHVYGALDCCRKLHHRCAEAR